MEKEFSSVFFFFVEQESNNLPLSISKRLERTRQVKREKNQKKFQTYLEKHREEFNQIRRERYRAEKSPQFQQFGHLKRKKVQAVAEKNPQIHLQEKRRTVKKLKELLPKTPEKRAAVIASLNNSPTTRQVLEESGLLNTKPSQQEHQLARAVFKDAATAVSADKDHRSRDSTTAIKVGLAIFCGEKVTSSRLRSSVAKKLNINRRRLSQVTQHRRAVLSNNTQWLDISRKMRSDAISDETKKLAYEFWASPDVSRPTGNKKDIVRYRVAAKTYLSHEKHLLEKCQTEVYIEFKQKYPEIKIGQRAF